MSADGNGSACQDSMLAVAAKPAATAHHVTEARIILAGRVLALTGGLNAGLAAAEAIERSADRQRTERREVSALLAEDAKGEVPARTAGDPTAVGDGPLDRAGRFDTSW